MHRCGLGENGLFLCYYGGEGKSREWGYQPFDPFTPRSDSNVTSPYNINTF